MQNNKIPVYTKKRLQQPLNKKLNKNSRIILSFALMVSKTLDIRDSIFDAFSGSMSQAVIEEQEPYLNFSFVGCIVRVLHHSEIE